MIWSLPLLVFVGCLLPLMAWTTLRQQAGADNAPEVPSARAMATQTIILQLVICGLALLGLWGQRLSVSWTSQVSPRNVLVAAGLLALAIYTAWREARTPLGAQDSLRRSLRRIAPFDPFHVATAVAAAIGEEFVYRGALTTILASPLGLVPAASVSAVFFGLGHLSQGLRGGILSLLFGLGLQWVAFLSGGIWLAIAIHLAYDLTVGWIGHRLGADGSAA